MPSLRRRGDGGLDVARARHRTSAFVYGNITVLGALIAADPHGVETGAAALAVLATAVATLVAHLTADLVAARIAPEGADEVSRGTLRSELRDATPIATSGTVPVLILLLGLLDAVPAALPLWIATALVVLRLAATGLVTERLSGRRASSAAVWGGVVLAAVSAVIAVVKAVLTH